MRRILDRYIFREIAMTWLSVTMVLLLILLTNQFARVLGDVAKGNLPKNAAMDVIGLSAAQYLTIIVPIGLFLAIMLALGRLYRDSELPAMMACRVGPGGIYRPVAWLLVPLALAVAWLSIDLAPRALQAVDRIGAEARRQADLASLEPGRFTMVGPENAVVYGERVTADGLMENVFLQRWLRWWSQNVVSRRNLTIRMFAFWFCTRGVATKAYLAPLSFELLSFWNTVSRIDYPVSTHRIQLRER